MLSPLDTGPLMGDRFVQSRCGGSRVRLWPAAGIDAPRPSGRSITPAGQPGREWQMWIVEQPFSASVSTGARDPNRSGCPIAHSTLKAYWLDAGSDLTCSTGNVIAGNTSRTKRGDLG